MDQLPEDFNWAFYLANNEDLVQAGFRTEEDAIGHFLSAGASEGRIYKNEEEQEPFPLMDSIPNDFDWGYYLFSHEDLVEATFRTEIICYTHYLQDGKREGRKYKHED